MTPENLHFFFSLSLWVWHLRRGWHIPITSKPILLNPRVLPISSDPGGPKERHQQLLLNTPLQRAGTRSEIAHVVLFTVSPAGSLITGETIIADGGARLGKGTSMASSMAMLEQINREGGGRRAQSKMWIQTLILVLCYNIMLLPV